MRKADDDDVGGSLSPLLAAASQFCYTMLQCEERHFRLGRSNSITPVAPFSSCSYFLMFPFSNVPKLSHSLFLIFLFAHVPIFSCSLLVMFLFSHVPFLFFLPFSYVLSRITKTASYKPKDPEAKVKEKRELVPDILVFSSSEPFLLEIESSA